MPCGKSFTETKGLEVGKLEGLEKGCSPVLEPLKRALELDWARRADSVVWNAAATMGDLTAVWTDIEHGIEQSGICLQKALLCNHQVQEQLFLWQTRDRLQAALNSCRQAINMSEELARAYTPAPADAGTSQQPQ